MKKGRLEAFSDGVLAIIITIMVLELQMPEGSAWADLKPLLPKFSSYLLSFIYVGIYWNNHHHMFQAIQKVSGKVLWANLALLFTLSLIPFATAWMGENHFVKNTVVFYGVVLMLPALAFYLLERASIHVEGKTSILNEALGKKYKELVSVGLYLVGILSSFYEPYIGLICYVAVAIMWLIPDKRIEKQLSDKR